MSTEALAARIAAMREKTDTSTTSSDRTPTSLETYLRLYNKAGRYGYIDYMEGARELYKFLSPIAIPSDVIFKEPKLPRVFHAYEVQQLALILAIPTGGYRSPDWQYIHNLVVYYTAKHILEEIT